MAEGAPILSSLDERRSAAERLDRRLLEYDTNIRPVIGIDAALTVQERMVVSEFVEMMPNSSLIMGGEPSYLLEIERFPPRTSLRHRDDYPDVIYQVTLRNRQNGKVIGINRQIGRCVHSEAMITFPIRCSLLEPFILWRALEML